MPPPVAGPSNTSPSHVSPGLTATSTDSTTSRSPAPAPAAVPAVTAVPALASDASPPASAPAPAVSSTLAPVLPAQGLALDATNPLSLQDNVSDVPAVKKKVPSLVLAPGPPGNDTYPAVTAPAPVTRSSSSDADPDDCDDPLDAEDISSTSKSTKRSSKKTAAKKTPKPRAKKITAKSLCLEEWEKEHGVAAKGFEAHWRARTPEQKKVDVAYETRAKELTELRKR